MNEQSFESENSNKKEEETKIDQSADPQNENKVVDVTFENLIIQFREQLID